MSGQILPIPILLPVRPRRGTDLNDAGEQTLGNCGGLRWDRDLVLFGVELEVVS
jgi:hypothetical protein